MKPLPTTSQASVAKGIWFVFPDNESVIRAWSAALTGNEQIYVNDQLVSSARRFNKISEHAFSAAGHAYRVVFTTENVMQGPLQCALYRNDTLLAYAQCRYIKPRNLTISILLALAAVGIAIGVIGEFNQLPQAFYGISFVVVTVLYLLTRKKGRFIVEDVATAQLGSQ